MYNIDIEDLKAKRQVVENDLNRFQNAINEKLSKGEYDIDNMCGRVNQLERILTSILNRLKQYDHCSPEMQTEQDRKAIAIIGGGRGVEIRVKNDDQTKYTVKRRKTYNDIIQQQLAPKPNGHAKQQQQQPQTTAV